MSSNKIQLINPYNYDIIVNINILEEELQHIKFLLENIDYRIKNSFFDSLKVLLKVRKFQINKIKRINKEIKKAQSKLNII